MRWVFSSLDSLVDNWFWNQQFFLIFRVVGFESRNLSNRVYKNNYKLISKPSIQIHICTSAGGTSASYPKEKQCASSKSLAIFRVLIRI